MMRDTERPRDRDASWALKIDELTAFRGPAGDRLCWWLMVVFFVLCALGGGSNRYDVASLLFLRPAAVAGVAAFLLVRTSGVASMSRVPLVLLGAYAAHAALQLVPLPPGLWTALPGRAVFAEAAAAAGLSQPWRPLTLVPDRTWGSLMATSTGFAVLLGMRRLRADQSRALVSVLLVIILVSGLLGVLQATAGPEGTLYLYRRTITGEAAGLFANRNHQAALLACALPLVRVWLIVHAGSPLSGRRVAWGVAAVGLLLVAMIIVTGSRAGVLLGVIGALGAALLAPVGTLLPHAGRTANRGLKLGLIAMPVALLAIMVASGRATSFNRLLTGTYVEARVLNLPAVMDMLRTFFPFGSGYGSFDRIFPMFESDVLLDPTYFNRAHDDYLEVAVTGGFIGVAILAAAIAWAARAFWRAIRMPPSRGTAVARGAGVVLVILAVGSIVDYPVRTPLIGAIAAIAFSWLATFAERARPGRSGRSPVASPSESG